MPVRNQTVNKVAGNVANQGIGTVALPALAAGAVGTVTISDTWIHTESIIFCQVKRGTTTAVAGAVATLILALRPATTGACIVDVMNHGAAATLATDYVLHYEVVT